MTAQEVAELVSDGQTLSFPGNASILVPDTLLGALEARFLADGHPRDLTVFEPCNASLGADGGILRFSHRGLMRRLVCSALPARAVELHRMIADNEIEAYCFPMGVLYSLARESGAGRPGLVSDVGLGTFVDPEQGGGGLNEVSKEELVSRIRIGEKDWLFYKSVGVDVCFLKATTADEHGNLTMESEPLTLGILTLAIAVRANGGKVFAQVERVARAGSLKPKDVIVPGHLVDGLVVVPDAPQSDAARHDPTITGEVAAVVPSTEVHGAADRIILSRAAAFLREGWLVNLGVGISNRLPQLLNEAGHLDAVTFSTEHGAFGGLPTEPPTFGAHINPQAVVDPTDTFNLYTGGGLDAAFLGMAEVDALGNINVSRFGTRIMGPGGFMDITVRTRRIFVCGQFTAKGLQVSIRDGKLSIDREGEKAKLVDKVRQVTLSGQAAVARRQQIVLITERGCFELEKEGWLLRQVAPGVDPQREIAPFMEFPLRVAKDLGVYGDEMMGVRGEPFAAWLAASLQSTFRNDRAFA